MLTYFSQMARSVADLVLVSGDFASIPVVISEGRRALRNLQRVTKRYVTKSAFAAFLILVIGTSSDAYPLLSRHLTLAASLTIGVPTFVLALAPSGGPWRLERFVRGVARFAVPARAVLSAGLVAATGMIVTAGLASAVAIAALALYGYSLRTEPGPPSFNGRSS